VTSAKKIDTVLDDGLRQLGLAPGRQQIERLLEFGTFVLSANKSTNLTGAKTLEDFVAAHILDSLAPLNEVRLADQILDLGSGAGLPGIPAAIVYPAHSFILLEPRKKRAAFLAAAVDHLHLSNVRVEQKSAGAAMQGDPGSSFGTVLMRAVANPSQSLRLGLPMVTRGGMLLLYEGRAFEPVPETSLLARQFGASITVRSVKVPFLEAKRHIWIVRRARTSSSTRSQFRLSQPRST
jgi:16S rRNA (guanine527-N7)-methyltransferase